MICIIQRLVLDTGTSEFAGLAFSNAVVSPLLVL